MLLTVNSHKSKIIGSRVYHTREGIIINHTEFSLIRTNENSTDALYIQIIEKIRRWMREGGLKEGDQLPSERELAQMFGTSRVPVREALKILEFLGAVQHVRGKGVFVRKAKVSYIYKYIDFIVTDAMETLMELFETRTIIEKQTTYLAAQRRTNADLAKMEMVILEMEQSIRLGLDLDVADTSYQFHTAVIAAAHNKVLITINESLAELLKFSRYKSLNDPQRYEASLEYHKRIFEKIRDQDADAAANLMQEHLDNAKKYITNIGCNNNE